jgi:YVTN family beta-propeller protein
MLWGVPGDPYVYSANTVSGSVTVLHRATGQMAAVIADVGKSPHAAQPHPLQPDRVFVMNIGPQAVGPDGVPDRGETIAEVVREGPAGQHTWRVARFLDLRADPELADSTRFPSRRAVCAGFTKNGRYMLVTLFNGGIAVVDVEAWDVVEGWGKDRIAEHGCGFGVSPTGDELYVTAGGLHASWLYVVDIAGNRPVLVASHDLSSVGQDAHGVYVDSRRNELWVVHRVSSNVTIHPLPRIREPGHPFETIAFVGKTPDLIAMSPDGARAFITLRGPNPAPTIPHATVGERPGVALLDVASRSLLHVVQLGDPEHGDFHAVFVP